MINRILFQFYKILFRLLARCFPPTPDDLKKREFQRILVFSAAGIGDTLTDSVAIRALKETFPNARLIVVTHRRRAAIVRHNPFVDEVILYHKSLLRFITLGCELRRRRPEAVLMLRGNDPDLWPLAYWANRHAVVSCPVMTRFRFLISHPVEIRNWDCTHGVEQTLEIVRSVGADTRVRQLVYRVREEERAQLQAKFQEHRFGDQPFVVFQLGGGRRSAWRDWPVSHFAELGNLLLATYKVRLVLLGGRDLQSKAKALKVKLPTDVVDCVGRLSLVESAALLSMARILVSTDTGIMHLGFAVGVDTLAMIHCNNPASRVGPYEDGNQHEVVSLEAPAGVAPSKNVDMALLRPERVWPSLRALCERRKLPPTLRR